LDSSATLPRKDFSVCSGSSAATPVAADSAKLTAPGASPLKNSFTPPPKVVCGGAGGGGARSVSNLCFADLTASSLAKDSAA